jgi:hypothetical protein
MTPEERREKRNEYLRAWYRRNLDRERERARAWRAKNLDRVRESGRERSRTWRTKNLDRARRSGRERMRAWYVENPDRARERMRAWNARNPDRVRANNRKHKYGLSPSDYAALLDSQNGACAICGTTPPKGLHVDHDHVTGRVRGLLCHPCNTGLGFLERPASWLASAARYLSTRGSTAPLPC